MPAPAREGEILDGKYRILRKLGEGGMGAVYAGEHVKVRKSVAIKILHAGASAVEEMADRFEREAQAAGQIGNDHIVEVYDLGVTTAGERYMVMEYLEGESLRSRIKRFKRMTFADVAPLLVQMLEGLEAAHLAGIIHRDLKPDNVFVVRAKAGRAAGEFVKILDFGISKFTTMEGSTTREGTVMGSPNYMSPEHVRSSSEVDARSDLYAVGVMLFEALTGVVPRKGANFAELLFKIAYEPMPDPRSIVPGIPDSVVALINKACATDRNARFESALELARALEALLTEGGGALAFYPATPPSAPRRPEAMLGDGPETIAFTPPAGAVPLPAPSNPGSRSQPSLLASVAGASMPGFSSSPGYASQPSFRSQPNLPLTDPEAANGTAVLSVPGGQGSQPSFASGSQPSFMGQPNAASQPSFTSQPGFGTGSQPSVNSTSQPSVGGATAAPFTVTHSTPSRRSSGAIFALVFAVVLGVGGAVLVVFVQKTTASNGSKPTMTATAATHAEPSVTAKPAATSTAQPVALTSAEPSAPLAAVSASAAIASASAKASAVKIGPRPKTPDPGY